MEMPLKEGSQVCIVGGGPAGSFAALHLLHLSKQKGIHLDISIYDHRDFSATGRQGCKGCAGILSSRLLAGLDSLGISLPAEVIQSELHNYTAYIDGEAFPIHQPDPNRRIVGVYRGSGPRREVGARLSGFDHYVITQACSMGARHISQAVTQVTYEDKPVIHTSQKKVRADLLVLANGVNSKIQLSPQYGYRKPTTIKMIHGEMIRPPNWPEDEVRIYFKLLPGMIFGALTPKGRYLNISLLGNSLTQKSIHDLIEVLGPNGGNLSTSKILCGCMPHIAVSAAHKFYGPRWVAVGDAAVSRLYKDGIGSAFYTTKVAMQTAIDLGVSHQAFMKAYAPYCRRIAFDNMFGHLFINLWGVIFRSPRLLAAWKKALRLEDTLPISQRVHTNNLWGMFTGDARYQDLFCRYLSWRSLKHLL